MNGWAAWEATPPRLPVGHKKTPPNRQGPGVFSYDGNAFPASITGRINA